MAHYSKSALSMRGQSRIMIDLPRVNDMEELLINHPLLPEQSHVSCFELPVIYLPSIFLHQTGSLTTDQFCLSHL